MYKLPNKNIYNLFALSIFFIYSVCASCISPHKINYLADIRQDTMGAEPIIITHVTPFVDPRIEPNDVLAITVQTTAQDEGNSPMTAQGAITRDVLSGFLVDKDGYVEVTLIGKMKVGGLTTSEARELLKQKASQLYNDPVVNLKIINFEIMVLGDVNKPGVVTLTNEKANIFDVLALCGDLQLTAKRQNILLIRTEGDVKKFVRLDVTQSSVFRSPYLYVKQRDVLIVEPSNYKIQNSDNSFLRYFSIGTTLISVVSLLFAFKIIK